MICLIEENDFQVRGNASPTFVVLFCASDVRGMDEICLPSILVPFPGFPAGHPRRLAFLGGAFNSGDLTRKM